MVAVWVVLNVLGFPLVWADEAQGGVSACRVAPVDPGEDRLPGLGLGGKLVAVREFPFHACPERFCDRFVPPRCDPRTGPCPFQRAAPRTLLRGTVPRDPS